MSKETKVLILENIPCWYKLRWETKRCGIVLAIHRETLSLMEERLRKSRLVELVARECGLDGELFAPFNPNPNADIWGFGGAIHSLGERGEFREFAVPFPKVRTKTSATCTKCDGSLQNQHGFECLFCNGTGTQHVFNWHEGYRVGASIALVLHALQFPDTETSSGDYHLTQITLNIGREQHGICADVSPVLCTFLNVPRPEIHEAMIADAQQVMQQAHTRIFGRERYSRECRALLHDGQLIFDCPGDACGFYTTDSRSHYQRAVGCQMSDHNVDHAGQSLTLLAGFASFLGSVDQYLRGTYHIEKEKSAVA